MSIKLDLIVQNRIYREGISHFLHQDDRVDLNATYTTCEQARRGLTNSPAEVLVVDYLCRDASSLLHTLPACRPNSKIVVLTYHSDSNLLADLAASGVLGIITNEDSMQDLVTCIVSVNSGHMCYPANFSRSLPQRSEHRDNLSVVDAFASLSLTMRQAKVMQLIEAGYSNKEIARQLNIELSTVKNHVHHILDRLQVKNRCEAAAVYRRSMSKAS